jgi:type IV pilus assembly protein PilE
MFKLRVQPFQARCSAANKRSLNGFTLIELMIVVAIIGILASIAIPAYSDYVRRGKLPEAFSRLSVMATKMEQYYQDNRNYGTTNCADVNTPTSLIFPSNATGQQKFNYGCELRNGGQGYVLIAAGALEATVGHGYTLSHTGQQSTTYFKGVVQENKNCWLSKGTEC